MFYSHYQEKVTSGVIGKYLNTLACSLVACVFPFKMHHATNSMKQGCRIVLQLHFQVNKVCNVSDANIMRIRETPIIKDENDCLFNFWTLNSNLFLKTHCLELIAKLRILLQMVREKQYLG